MNPGPHLIFFPALFDFVLNGVPVGTEDKFPIFGPDLLGHIPEAAMQVLRGCQIDSLFIIVECNLDLKGLFEMFDSGLEIGVIIREKRGHGAFHGTDRFTRRWVIFAQKGCQGIKSGFLHSRLEFLRALAFFHGRACQDFFLINIIYAHKCRRVADVPNGLVVFFNQEFKDAGIAPNLFVLALRHQINNFGSPFLSVPVDSSVSLLKDHQ